MTGTSEHWKIQRRTPSFPALEEVSCLMAIGYAVWTSNSAPLTCHLLAPNSMLWELLRHASFWKSIANSKWRSSLNVSQLLAYFEIHTTWMPSKSLKGKCHPPIGDDREIPIQALVGINGLYWNGLNFPRIFKILGRNPKYYGCVNWGTPNTPLNPMEGETLNIREPQGCLENSACQTKRNTLALCELMFPFHHL